MFQASTPTGGSSLFGPSGPATGGIFGSGGGVFASSTPSQSGPSTSAQSQPSIFGQPQSQPSLVGQPQTPSSNFGQQQSQPSLFGQSPAQQSAFGQQQLQPSTFGQSQVQIWNAGSQVQQPQVIPGSMQLQTQMAPVAPLAVPLPDRELQPIIQAYDANPNNPNYKFWHLLLTVKEPQLRFRPPGVSESMWQEAIRQLEGMDATDRERLWPELIEGFNGLSKRLLLQDQAMREDAEYLRKTQTYVRMLQRSLENSLLPRIQQLKCRDDSLHKRLLRLMRHLQALESKGLQQPLTDGELQLLERLRWLVRQTYGAHADLLRRADTVLSTARLEARGGAAYAEELGGVKIIEQSAENMRLVLEQQMDAIARLVSVLTKDIQDVTIMEKGGK